MPFVLASQAVAIEESLALTQIQASEFWFSPPSVTVQWALWHRHWQTLDSNGRPTAASRGSHWQPVPVGFSTMPLVFSQAGVAAHAGRSVAH